MANSPLASFNPPSLTADVLSPARLPQKELIDVEQVMRALGGGMAARRRGTRVKEGIFTAGCGYQLWSMDRRTSRGTM